MNKGFTKNFQLGADNLQFQCQEDPKAKVGTKFMFDRQFQGERCNNYNNWFINNYNNTKTRPKWVLNSCLIDNSRVGDATVTTISLQLTTITLKRRRFGIVVNYYCKLNIFLLR